MALPVFVLFPSAHAIPIESATTVANAIQNFRIADLLASCLPGAVPG